MPEPHTANGGRLIEAVMSHVGKEAALKALLSVIRNYSIWCAQHEFSGDTVADELFTLFEIYEAIQEL